MNQEGIELAPVSEEQQMAALKTAHRHAESIEETVMFAQMLGIIPTSERATCSRCGGPLESTSQRLWRDRRGDICAACYRRELKDRKAVDV
jgi:hypothetical protein